MSSSPTVSVICLTYNHEKYVEEALKGFICQETSFPVQFLIGDDVSTDSTREIVSRYAALDSRIKPFFRESNMGPVPNAFDLLNSQESDFVAVCDGDDFWTDPLKLQKQVDYMRSHPEASLCFHLITELDQTTGLSEVNSPFRFASESSRSEQRFSYKDLVDCNFIASVSVLWRWQYAKGHAPRGLLKNRNLGDYPIHLIHAFKGEIAFIKENMATYRKHGSGVWSLQVSKKARRRQAVELLNAFWLAANEPRNPHVGLLLDRIKGIYDSPEIFFWPRLKRQSARIARYGLRKLRHLLRR